MYLEKLWLSILYFFTTTIFQLRIFLINTIKTLPRDVKALFRLKKLSLQLRLCKRKNATVGSLFDDIVAEHPEKICFYFENEKWTFYQVQEYANKIANCFKAKGFKHKDCIALMMSNRPEFICTWLGLSKIGVVTSWINTNLRNESLINCIKAGNSKAIVFGSEVYDSIAEIYTSASKNLPKKFSWFILHSSTSTSFSMRKRIIGGDQENEFIPTELLPTLIKSSSRSPILSKIVNFEDNLCLVFTSGTTGLPKAVVFTHARAISMIYGPHYMLDLSPMDVLYTPLPLYHVQGGLCGVGQAILFGMSQVIVPRFSVSKFWPDCLKYNVSVAQYLGEVCRYLLKCSSPLERAHSVKKFFGNGMKLDVWRTFLDRFNYPQIMELYGASEGNCQMANFDAVVGVCGSTFYGLLQKIFPSPIQLFRVDEELGQLLRDPVTGFAIPCKVGERGELLGLIEDNPMRKFCGYTDPQATKQKLATDVRRKGDRYFRSGDILYLDDLYYFHFVDRLGSSYRWKGENISSEEVTNALSRIIGMELDIVTFGVVIPHTDGKAGMAVISIPSKHNDDDKDPSTLNLDLETTASDIIKLISASIQQVLPSYSRPVFIRFTNAIESTGTFKLQNTRLKRDGFDLNKVKDPLYCLLHGETSYTPMTVDIHQRIMQGIERL